MVSELHGFHRLTYMAERRSYYQRKETACNYPGQYMSIIADGMSQNHTALPWLGKSQSNIFIFRTNQIMMLLYCSEGNLKQFPNELDQHLQGLLDMARK
jgi:hypothetical protein